MSGRDADPGGVLGRLVRVASRLRDPRGAHDAPPGGRGAMVRPGLGLRLGPERRTADDPAGRRAVARGRGCGDGPPAAEPPATARLVVLDGDGAWADAAARRERWRRRALDGRDGVRGDA